MNTETYEIKVFYSKEDEGWIATIPELPGCSAFGRTPEKSLDELKTAKGLWLEASRKEKRHVPKPLADSDLNGKFLLRLPKELHRKLAYEAKEQGVSLNQFMLYIMAQYAHLGSQVACRTAPYGKKRS